MTKAKKIVLIHMIGLSLFICMSMDIAYAAEGIGFSYHNKVPDNQLTEGAYFDLLIKPAAKQTLETEIKNESTETIKVKININDSRTTGNGLIEYGPSKLKSSNKPQYKLTELLTGPTEITLKKGEVRTIKFLLTTPEKPFDGVILGGVQLERILGKQENKEALLIKNNYAYVFSVSLRQNEKKIPYALVANDCRYIEVNNDPYTNIIITNDSQEIVKDMTISTNITKSGSNEVLVEKVQEGVKMAPMSVMEYLIEFPDAEPGVYIAKTKAKAGEQEFYWEQEFEITEVDSPINKQKLIEKENNLYDFKGVIVVFLTIIVGTIILYIVIRSAKK